MFRWHENHYNLDGGCQPRGATVRELFIEPSNDDVGDIILVKAFFCEWRCTLIVKRTETDVIR